MGCACSNMSLIENNINDMWNNTVLINVKSSDLILLFEKATAYKKNLKSHEVFSKIFLNPLLINKNNVNEDLEFLINNHLDVSKEHSFEIPFTLLFMTKIVNDIEAHQSFLDLFTIIEGRMNNPKKLKKNIPSLKIILEYYVSVISLFSLQSFILKFEDHKKDIINEFSKIYSVNNIKRHLERIFHFEKKIKILDDKENAQIKNPEEIEREESLEILQFFNYNFDKLNPSYIRECLYEFEKNGLNSEENIKKDEQDNNKINNLFSPKKTKIIKKIYVKKSNIENEKDGNIKN